MSRYRLKPSSTGLWQASTAKKLGYSGRKWWYGFMLSFHALLKYSWFEICSTVKRIYYYKNYLQFAVITSLQVFVRWMPTTRTSKFTETQKNRFIKSSFIFKFFGGKKFRCFIFNPVFIDHKFGDLRVAFMAPTKISPMTFQPTTLRPIH